MFKMGVDSFIWAEVFEEKDLWILAKAKELGFETVDLAIAYPDKSLLKLQRKEKAGIEVVATTTLQKDWNSISSNPEVRKDGVKILKNLLI